MNNRKLLPKLIPTVLSTVLSFGLVVSAQAADPAVAQSPQPSQPSTPPTPQPSSPPPSASTAPAAAGIGDGEIRKIDKETKKVTIKHGEIKNLDMPAMTMVFQVKDASMLDTFKAGDKVKFAVEKAGSSFLVTEMQANK